MDRKPERDGALRIEPQPHVPEAPETLRHQSRTDKECERKGDLPHHQKRSDDLLAAAARHAADRSRERARQVAPPSRAQERHAREQAGTREREAKDDGEDGDIHTDLAEARDLVRRETEMHLDRRARQGVADGTANDGEKHALAQEATEEVTVCRAERVRDRALVP